MVADHAHPDSVVTAIEPVLPGCVALMVRGLTVNVHDAATCVTVNVLPAIVSVADLPTVVTLAAAVNPTLPLPLPVAPLVIVTHDAPLVPVQLHPAVVVTATVPVPPVAGTAWVAAEMVYTHAAACVIVSVLPAIVTVPVLGVASVLAETV